MKQQEPHNIDPSFLPLLQRSLSWEYFGGSHSNPCCHPETDWRLMPFLVIVCSEKGEYISRIKDERFVNVREGETLLVPSGVQHTVGMPNPGVVSFAHIHYTVFGSMDIFRFFEVPRHVKGAFGKEIGRLTHNLHEAMIREPAGGDALIQAVIRQDLASRLLRAILSVSKFRAMESGDLLEITRMEPVFSYVEKHIGACFSFGDTVSLCFQEHRRRIADGVCHEYPHAKGPDVFGPTDIERHGDRGKSRVFGDLSFQQDLQGGVRNKPAAISKKNHQIACGGIIPKQLNSCAKGKRFC
jgi:hypothetical protein